MGALWAHGCISSATAYQVGISSYSAPHNYSHSTQRLRACQHMANNRMYTFGTHTTECVRLELFGAGVAAPAHFSCGSAEHYALHQCHGNIANWLNIAAFTYNLCKPDMYPNEELWFIYGGMVLRAVYFHFFHRREIQRENTLVTTSSD